MVSFRATMKSKKSQKFSLRNPDQEAFWLQTGDVAEDKPIFSKSAKKDALARLLGAGGTHDTRRDASAFPYRRSWNRFCFILIALILIWIIGFFLP
jgi:hypothetical protein